MRRSWLAAVGTVGLACGGARDQQGGELHARRAVLAREVDGLRALVTRLERGETALPVEDVAISLDEALLRDLVRQQLPLEAKVDRFDLRLDRVSASFRGSPLVTLEGRIQVRDQPEVVGDLRVLGALAHLAVANGMLRASIEVDHLDILSAGGFEAYLDGGTMDELARRLRNELDERLPDVTIPVRLQQTIELPDVEDGPVRLLGASLPLDVSVSSVLASGGKLWIAVHVEPGEFRRAEKK